MSRLARLRAIVGLGLAQLRRSPGRTVLAIGGVVLAVLSVTLLAGLGIGVVETGQEQFDDAGRDIWITGGPAAGGENEVVDAPAIASDLREREDVGDVSTVALHDVYLGTDPDAVEPLTAVGVEGTHAHFEFEDGAGFDGALTADGEDAAAPTDVVVLDPETADRFDVGVGDTVYVGAGPGAVDAYTVVGIGSYYSQFLGTETATIPLPELQSMTGTAGADRASFVTVNLADGVDREAVADDVRADYPAYDVRTADDQFAAMLTDRLLLVAGGVALVGLSIVGGAALTANLFVLVAYQQRDALAALRAIGLSRGVLAGTVGVQGAVVGLLGGAIGVAATPALAAGLNALSTRLVGFERLVRTPLEVSALGFAVAVVVGTLVAIITGWQASRSATLESLDS
ncbi:ABC transporter permease [Natronococcus occultus]|uniref:ABC-type transport system, involved in lipoprotein release, permease component n=1 Tax=Natronococcus occultus SP4 TaxID=694430 RepID=L0K1V6_9EURY|nr:ABC transporter permease [Natronococcus occultus]AGB38986.1 ABC-type transport system, involved in lipoprotein release, permease component [Natronococcus occultus SP4]